MVGFLVTILWVLFILSSVVIVTVVLLQEGKGGGLAEAFGGMGAETFGVKAKGITVFTFIVAAVFIVSAIGINLLASRASGPFSGAPLQAPAAPGGGDAPGGQGAGGSGGADAGTQGASGEGANGTAGNAPPAPANPAGKEQPAGGGGGGA